MSKRRNKIDRGVRSKSITKVREIAKPDISRPPLILSNLPQKTSSGVAKTAPKSSANHSDASANTVGCWREELTLRGLNDRSCYFIEHRPLSNKINISRILYIELGR